MQVDPILIVLVALVALLAIVLALSAYHYTHRAAFKPTFVDSEAGKPCMEFYDFSKNSASPRTKRFYEEYTVGKKISHEDKDYEITNIEENSEPTLLGGSAMKIVVHLKELK
ncbi:MAG: hypothetical protein LBB42_03215 [Coriobacteriales bacterium]|nr:hypothetical protein [Coriobacteriales bacterium]